MSDMVWQLRRDTISWRRSGETVIVISHRTSAYLSVDGTALIVWDALANGATVEEILGRVTEQYDVEAEEARVDIQRFLSDLLRRQMVSTHINK